MPFESFFTGRKFPEDGAPIVIGESEKVISSLFTLQHVYMAKTEETVTNENGETVTKARTQIVVKPDLDKIADKNISPALRIVRNHKRFFIKLDDLRLDLHWEPFESSKDSLPCSYIPTQFISMDELAGEWDKIALTEHTEQVKIALRFIENALEGLAFVKDEDQDHWKYRRSRGRHFERTAKVKIRGIKQPIPLNSMGDGMLRVLQLALKIFPAKGGVLLIDEFDNGLHFSVQKKIWSWLFDIAKELNIQVFATTHSWDCVDSFAKVAAEKPASEGVLFRVGQSVRTSDNGKIIATVFDSEALKTITQSDVEVR